MLRQQRGLKLVLAYVTNVLVKMNKFRTRCMLFYFAKTIKFVSWGNIFPFCLHLFLKYFQQYFQQLFAATCLWFPFSAKQSSENSCNGWSWLIVIEIDWSGISIESIHILIEINQEYFNHVQSHFNRIQPGTFSFCKRVILNQGTILTRHTVLSGRCHCTLKVFSNGSESL